jgi:hypothetical protein
MPVELVLGSESLDESLQHGFLLFLGSVVQACLDACHPLAHYERLAEPRRVRLVPVVGNDRHGVALEDSVDAVFLLRADLGLLETGALVHSECECSRQRGVPAPIDVEEPHCS